MAKSSIHIDAAASRVFAHISDLTKHGEWASHRLSLEPEQPDRTGIGTRYRSKGEQFGRELNDTLTVTAYEPNRRFVFESAGFAGTWRHTYEVEADGDGVLLRRRMEPAHLPFFVKLISPLFDLGLPRRNQKDLVRLKALLEAGKGQA